MKVASIVARAKISGVAASLSGGGGEMKTRQRRSMAAGIISSVNGVASRHRLKSAKSGGENHRISGIISVMYGGSGYGKRLAKAVFCCGARLRFAARTR
jgi:hypothetical protein